jgi:hypothetical protein
MKALVLMAALLLLPLTSAAERLRLRHPTRGFQMRMTPFVIPAGGEREVCEYRTLPNRKPMDVAGFELNMTKGAHHFVLWEYLGKDRNPADFPHQLVDAPGCVGVGPRDNFLANANLFGMQTARARLRFPPGVAVRLEPQAPVFLNAHLRNFSATEPLTAGAVFNVIPARRGTVQHHAQALIVGNAVNIDIPPRLSPTQPSTASFTAEWRTAIDLNVVQLSSHQHARGRHVAIHVLDAAGNDLGLMFEATDWEHPGERWFSPAFRVPAGGGFRFTCGWENDEDRTVRFGVTTRDEMCFVTGYFYPDDESQPLPPQPGCFPQGAGLLCFGPKISG